MRYRLEATFTLVMMLLVAAVGLVTKGSAAAEADLPTEDSHSALLLPYISDGTVRVMEFVSQLNGGGGSGQVVVRDNYAYIDEGPRLVVLNVTNPAAPTVVGQSPPLEMEFADLAVADNTAWVVGELGLRGIDVSNPAAPTPIGAYTGHGKTWGVAVANNTP